MKLLIVSAILAIVIGGQADARMRGAPEQAPGVTNVNLGSTPTILGRDLPFANFFKGWGLAALVGGTGPNPSTDTFDANLYPTSASLTTAMTGPVYFMSTAQMTSATRWVIAWDGLIGGDATHGLSSASSGFSNVVDPGSCVKANNAFTALVAGTDCIVSFTWRTASITPSFSLTAGATFNGTLNNLILARCEPVWAPDCAATVAAIKANPAKLNPDFLSFIQGLRPQSLRFVNWNGTNNGGGTPQSMQTNFSNIVPTTAMSYQMAQYTAYNGTVTGSGTNNYVCNSGGGCTSSAVALTEGLTVQAKFTNPGSAAATFNASASGTTLTINSLSAGTIAIGQELDISIGNSVVTITGGSGTTWTISASQSFSNRSTTTWSPTAAPRLCVNNINGCEATPANAPRIAFQSQNSGVSGGVVSLLSPTKITANSFQTLRYDSLLNAWISGCQSSCIGDFFGGVPPLAMAAVSNEANVDLWYTVPCFATDDFITNVATQLLQSIRSDRNVIFEWANEVWNTVYACTSWASARGSSLSLNGTDANRNRSSYYGLRTRQMAGLVEAAAAAIGKTNYRIALANQFGDAVDSQSYRFNGAALNPTNNSALCTWLGGTFSGTCSGAPNYSAATNRPADHAHYGAYAPYYAGAQYADTDDNYAAFSGQTEFTINGGTKGATTTLQTSVAHGYSTGDRVCTGLAPGQAGGGTAFTGDWAALNYWCFNVTVTSSTQFTVPYDSSGFSANWSSNGGSAKRTGNQFNVITTAADQYAAGNYSTAWATLDGDIRNGTNWGQTPIQSGNSRVYPVASFISTYYPQWATIIESYTSARPNGVVGMQVAMYENGFQGSPPAGATFTATIDGSGNMTVSAVSTGQIAKGSTGGASTLTNCDGTGIAGFGYGIRVTGGAGGGNTGSYTLTNAGSLTIASPTQLCTGVCGMLGYAQNYCGPAGKLANLLGYNSTTTPDGTITPSSNSYKLSSTFQATTKYQLDQYMAASTKAALPGWLLLTGGGQWSLLTGELGSTPFGSYYALQNYHYP